MKNIKHFLTIKDLTPQELFFLVEKSDKLQQKTKKNKDISNSYTSGKKAVSFFSKSSSRTKSA
jgi:ornithine carbamoyltransferase